MQSEGVVIVEQTVRQEPEYWRDPWSRSLATVFFATGVVATVIIGTGLDNVVMLAIGAIFGVISIVCLASFVLYNCGCLCQDEKKRFKQEEGMLEIMEQRKIVDAV